MKIKNVNEKGISIIETVIYIGLFSLLIVVLVDIFSFMLVQKANSQKSSYLNQDYNYIFLKLKHDINNSQSITTPSYNTVTNNLVLVKDSNIYEYKMQNNNFILLINNVEYKLNSNQTYIDNLFFTKVSNNSKPSVIIDFDLYSLDKNINQENQSLKFNTTLGVR